MICGRLTLILVSPDVKSADGLLNSFSSVKSAPLWELVKPVPGNEPPPKRTGHIMLSMDDTLYMYVYHLIQMTISLTLEQFRRNRWIISL